MRNVTHTYKKTGRLLLSVLLAVLLLLSATGCKKDTNKPNALGEQTEQSGNQNVTQTGDDVTNATYEVPVDDEPAELKIGEGLVLTDTGKYTGIYMEDGTDEVVTNIMMIIVRNDNEQDIQLARINLMYADFVAEFEATNLPAGESVVLLEKNRHDAVNEDYLGASLENIAFFQNKMGLCEDRVKISGTKGSIQLENLTDEPLGEIHVFYKNSSVDLLYGGITYRARLQSGLQPGETMNVPTGHYNPDTCTIVNVQILELDTES